MNQVELPHKVLPPLRTTKMHHNVFFIPILLIFVIIFPCYAQYFRRKEESRSCNLTESKEGKQILDETFFPKLVEHRYTLPKECPLHPKYDLITMLAQATQIPPNYIRKWRCSLCNKHLTTPTLLESHLLHEHADDVIKGEEIVCLSDFCDMLHCPSAVEKLKKKCDQNDLNRRNYVCNAMLRLCFPDESEITAQILYTFFRNEICDKLNCTEIQLGGRQRERSSLWIIVTIFLFVGGVLWYTLLLVYNSDSDLFAKRSRTDLRRLTKRSWYSSLWQFCTKRKKIKAY
jgi:hypothetical protein